MDRSSSRTEARQARRVWIGEVAARTVHQDVVLRTSGDDEDPDWGDWDSAGHAALLQQAQGTRTRGGRCWDLALVQLEAGTASAEVDTITAEKQQAQRSFAHFSKRQEMTQYAATWRGQQRTR